MEGRGEQSVSGGVQGGLLTRRFQPCPPCLNPASILCSGSGCSPAPHCFRAQSQLPLVPDQVLVRDRLGVGLPWTGGGGVGRRGEPLPLRGRELG